MKTILFTGGHHNSALEVILDLNKSPKRNEFRIVWVGRKYSPNGQGLSPEYSDLTPHISKFHHISAGKLHRIRSIKYFPKFLMGLLLIPVGFIRAFFIVISEKPNLIVSWGGYLALPFVVVAKILKIKSITHEQTLTIGLANHIISNFVDKIYTAWPVRYYPKSLQTKCVYVGLPLRQISKSPKKIFENNKPNLLVMGGKMGSHFINKVVSDNLEKLVQDYNIIWSCGLLNGDYSRSNILKRFGSTPYFKGNVLLKEYFTSDEMANIFPQIDIAFSRSGGHTIYEYIAFNIRCLLCPMPISSKNEQLKNAELIKEIGLAEILEEKDYNKESFLNQLAKIRGYDVEKISAKFQIIRDANQKLSAEICSII